MEIVINVLIVLLTFVCMEGVTWLTHKYVMHGFLWSLHEDHHQKKENEFFEKNDGFFIIFAVMSMSFIVVGDLFPELSFLIFVGVGITMYGLAYFIVHDIFIHQRFKLFTRTDNFYFRGLRKAHKVHHKHLYKPDGECFGMLWVPVKYFKEAMKNK